MRRGTGIKRAVRKVLNRSGTGVCDTCGEKHILIGHHINGRDIPNHNHPSNVVNICDNCHREVHEGRIVLEKWMMTTGGRELLWHSRGQESLSGVEATPYLIGGKRASSAGVLPVTSKAG